MKANYVFVRGAEGKTTLWRSLLLETNFVQLRPAHFHLLTLAFFTLSALRGWAFLFLFLVSFLSG